MFHKILIKKLKIASANNVLLTIFFKAKPAKPPQKKRQQYGRFVMFEKVE